MSTDTRLSGVPLAEDTEECARCGHTRLWHANFGTADCQHKTGCSCHEFKQSATVPPEPSQEQQETLMHNRLRALIAKIQAWRTDEELGYDTAIGVLNDIENELEAILAEGVPPAERNELELFERLSKALTGGNAATWDEVLHAAEAATVPPEPSRRLTREEIYESFIADRGVSHVCKRCLGLGTQAYANTSTWRKGAGGSAITIDVCDWCWGSGDEHNRWPSRRTPEPSQEQK